MIAPTRRLPGLVAAVAVMLLTCSSAAADPSGNLPGPRQTDSFGTVWREVGADNFTVKAPLGSWASQSVHTVVYRGDHGMGWRTDPDGWGCKRYIRGCYQPAKVLSVHDGMLDYWLHPCRYANGTVAACGATVSPVIPAHDGLPASRYMVYGRFEAKMKVIFSHGTLGEYHMAWLLWPREQSAHECAESDYPEMNLDWSSVDAYDHRGCHGVFDHFYAPADLAHWHVYTQEWGPGFRRYYLDGRLVGQDTKQVWSGAERWDLQVSARTPQYGSRGHVLVDWVWIGTPARKRPSLLSTLSRSRRAPFSIAKRRPSLLSACFGADCPLFWSGARTYGVGVRPLGL